MRAIFLSIIAAFCGCASGLGRGPAARGHNHFLEAIAAETRGNFEGAISRYTAAIAEYGKIGERDADYSARTELLSGAYSGRGYLYAKRGEHDKAIADANEFIKLNPDNYAGYVSRSARFQAAGRCDEALRDAEKIQEIRRDIDSLENRANMKVLCGRPREALEDYNALVARMGVRRPDLHCIRGRILLGLSRPDDARKDFSAGCGLDREECCSELDALGSSAPPPPGPPPPPARSPAAPPQSPPRSGQ